MLFVFKKYFYLFYIELEVRINLIPFLYSNKQKNNRVNNTIKKGDVLF